VARLGGDEFVVVCVDIETPDTATAIARRVAAALEPSLRVGVVDTVIGASIGIAFAGPDDTSADEVLRRQVPARSADWFWEPGAPRQRPVTSDLKPRRRALRLGERQETLRTGRDQHRRRGLAPPFLNMLGWPSWVSGRIGRCGGLLLKASARPIGFPSCQPNARIRAATTSRLESSQAGWDRPICGEGHKGLDEPAAETIFVSFSGEINDLSVLAVAWANPVAAGKPRLLCCAVRPGAA
jgi:Diguanylate cyclase, GGDEF domain